MQRSIRVVLKVSRKPSEASTQQIMNPINNDHWARVLVLVLVRLLERMLMLVLVLVQMQVPMRGLRFGRGL